MNHELFDLHASVEDRHWWFVGRRRIIHALLETLMPPHSGGVIVDVGAGTGGNAGSLVEGYRAVALEPSAPAVRHARLKHPGLLVVRTDAPEVLDLSLATGVAWLLLDVAEHVLDDFELISRIVAVMAPGAHLLITVPANPRLWSKHDVVFGHHRRYTASRLRATWDGLPVRPLLLADLNWRLAPVTTVVRAAGRVFRTMTSDTGDLGPPPPLVNGVLTRIFGGERFELVRRLRRGTCETPREAGISLVAVLERLNGRSHVRTRPPDTQPDSELRR